MIGERHKSRDLVTIPGQLHLYLLLLGLGLAMGVPASGHVVEVLAQSQSPSSTASTPAGHTVPQTTKTNASQDGDGDGAPLTAGATTAPRPDPNNNNEWRPLGHGDPLQKDPTYDYSPPALDRVRYWAENNSTGQSNPEARKKELPPEVLRNKTKSEILVLGMASERVRVPHSHSYPSAGQQAKYAAIRRSYYAPTQQQKQQQQMQQQQMQQQHQQQNQEQQHQQQQHQQQQQMQQQQKQQMQQQQQQHQQQMHQQQMQHQTQHMQTHLHQQQQNMPHTHLMPPPMLMMKSSGTINPHLEYRHSMMATGAPTSYMSLSHMSSPPPKQAMTSSVIYHQPSMSHHSPASASSASWHPSMSSMPPHRLSYSDPHLQESMNTYSFSRPHLQQGGVSYSPNSLPGQQSGSKAGLRKPWLHELLQKEVVMNKPKVKPTMPATKYLMGTTKPHYSHPPAAYGISSTRPPFTYAPVTFVPGPPTIAVPTMSTRAESQQEIYITPTPQTSSSGFRPMLVTSPTTMATTPPTTPTPQPIYQRATTTSNRLLIPQTSNLAHRPTVAPAPTKSEATTDSLFSHYKQPQKPLLGPMYLIIEGHSKVKTYGQNELDPHSPKIVPVISKREPVVRIADPNEKRGTVETYQVKHLHTKTTPMPPSTTTTTTTTPKPTTTRATTKSPVTSTKPPIKSTAKTTKSPISSTTKTAALTTSKTTEPPKPPTTRAPLILPLPEQKPPNGVNDLLSFLDNMFADAHEIASSPSPTPAAASSTVGTILKPVSTKLLPQQPEPRISSKAGSIESLLDGDDDEAGEDSGSAISTETPPRATRQVFDYDQLPESRIKEGVTVSDIMEYNDDDEEEEEETVGEDGQLDTDADEEEEGDSEHNLLKRFDQFVDDVDDGDDDLEDLIGGLDDEEIDERRQQH
ncbi:hypothetical protein KR009_011043 [Drosophila setifemur]|nr:hypothetical protein KR009_011043 [Drosophila setifemur]